MTVEATIVEVLVKNSPTGQRMLTKPYPKDNEPRTMGLTAELVAQLGDYIADRRLKPGDLLFATRDGTPHLAQHLPHPRLATRRPASEVDFNVRVHDLRHAHASWLLAGGSDLKSVMERTGHAQITTTQKYLHALPDADTKNLTALDRTRNSGPSGAQQTRSLTPIRPVTDQLASPLFKRTSRWGWTPPPCRAQDRNKVRQWLEPAVHLPYSEVEVQPWRPRPQPATSPMPSPSPRECSGQGSA